MNSDTKELANAINALAKAHANGCEKIAESLNKIAFQLQYLGNGNASTQMGAIEGLAVQIKEGLETVGSAVRSISDNLEHK